MEKAQPEHGSKDDDDKIPYGTCVDISESYEIRTDNLCLGKVLGGRPIKRSAVHSVLQHAWNRYAGVRVQNMSGDLILFDFSNELDQIDALDWSPWAI